MKREKWENCIKNVVKGLKIAPIYIKNSSPRPPLKGGGGGGNNQTAQYIPMKEYDMCSDLATSNIPYIIPEKKKYFIW